MISKNKGITLIALVVTIIVLIILATVSISMVTGENGLIKKAEQARDAYENSSEREDARMNEMLKEMAKAEGIIGPNGLPTVNTLTTIQKENIKAEDRQGNKITIPKGFKVKSEYGTNVNGGIVIEDGEGNQFVWVPCKEEEYKKHEYETQTVDDIASEKADTGNGEWVTSCYRKWSDWTDEGYTEKNKESIKANGGFYVARYEAGVPKEASFYVGENTENKIYSKDKNKTEEGEKKLKPVSKAENQCWNYISQINAKTVSENMYKDDTENNNYGVRSQLIDGVAWDVITEWIEDEISGIASNSIDYGNYCNTHQRTVTGLYANHTDQAEPASKYEYEEFSIGGGINVLNKNRIEMATGLVDEFKLKNIYDMAGNIAEWTTESGSHGGQDKEYGVHRGGNYRISGEGGELSFRRGYDITGTAFQSIGFRVVLYVQ